MNHRNILYTLTTLVFSVSLYSQDIKKDVTVMKAYEPTVQNAEKISVLPTFNDTNTLNPNFEYNISPVRLDLNFQPRPVPAAKMSQEPIKRLYNNYLKLGYGNPYSPLAEISISNGRSKNNAFGLFLGHHLASGDVRLNDKKKVEAPFSDNEAELYGRHLFNALELSGNIFYSGNKSTFYGIDTTVNQVYDKKNYTQHYQKAGVALSLASLKNDSDKLNYSVSGGFRYLSDNYDVVENNFNLKSVVGKKLKSFYVGAQASFDYYKPGSGNDSAFNHILVIRPFLSKKSEMWRFEIAMNLTFDTDDNGTQLYGYPSALFEFNIAPSVLKAFVSYSGFLEDNNLDKIRLENLYIFPGLKVKNSNYKTQVSGGFKGSFSESVNFLATASYSSIENQYFFINDTLPTSVFYNYFQVVYDNIDKIQIGGEIDYMLNEKIQLITKGNFYNYTTFKQQRPWHLPNFDVTAGLKYNLRDKIILTSDAYLVGKRYAMVSNKEISLDPYFDLNLGLEYRYSKLLSAFIQFRNLTASQYQIWNQYPAYRFQAMAGFTYMF